MMRQTDRQTDRDTEREREQNKILKLLRVSVSNGYRDWKRKLFLYIQATMT